MVEKVPPGAWPTRFFGGNNTLRWKDVQARTASDDWSADIMPWMELLERSDSEVPVILPHRNMDGQVNWYGVARTPRDGQYDQEV